MFARDSEKDSHVMTRWLGRSLRLSSDQALSSLKYCDMSLLIQDGSHAKIMGPFAEWE
jgi:hypothetical protein